jgi:putative FmdB family regulatory protein
MPTYEYQREDGSVFEVIQKFSDTPLTVCPDSGQPVRRMITGGSGVIYKGSGWYITDYKNGAPKKSTAATSGTGDAEKTTTPETKTVSETPAKSESGTAKP